MLFYFIFIFDNLEDVGLVTLSGRKQDLTLKKKKEARMRLTVNQKAVAFNSLFFSGF